MLVSIFIDVSGLYSSTQAMPACNQANVWEALQVLHAARFDTGIYGYQDYDTATGLEPSICEDQL